MQNLTSVMVECHAYIDAIDDFQIETPGRLEVTPDVITQFTDNQSVKMLLTEFLFECEKESAKSNYDLMQLLKGNKQYFEKAQVDTIGRLNERIEKTSGEQRTKYKDQQKRFIDYFFHNYALIDLIIARLTNSPLPKHLQFILKQVGLEQIIDNNKFLTNSSNPNFTTPQYDTPSPATLTPPTTEEQIKLSHAQIAILYHIIGRTINENNANDIALKYGQTSGKKLANTYKSLTSELDRTGKGKYTVKNYEMILPLITDKHKVHFEKELATARKNNKKY